MFSTMNKYSATLSHVTHMEFAWLIVSSQWVTEVTPALYPTPTSLSVCKLPLLRPPSAHLLIPQVHEGFPLRTDPHIPYIDGNIQIFYVHLWHEYEIWISWLAPGRKNWIKWCFESFTNTSCKSLKNMKNSVVANSTIQNFESCQLE